MNRAFLSIIFVFVNTCFGVRAAYGESLDSIQARCYKVCYARNYNELYTLSAAYLKVVEARRPGSLYAAYANFYHGVSLLFHVGDSSARESFAKSLSIADKLHNDTMACRALNGLGLYAYIIENNYYTAQRYYISALERIKKNGHERLQTGIYGNLAEMSLAQNDTAGLGYARMSYIMAKKINNYGAIAFGAYCIAAHYSLRRQYAKALAYADESCSYYAKIDKRGQMPLYTLYTEILLGMGRVDDAQTYADKAWKMVPCGDSVYMVNLHYQQARIYNVRRQYMASVGECRKVLGLADKTHYYDTWIYDLMADNYLALGRYADAVWALRRRIQATDIVRADAAENMLRERNMLLEIARKEQDAAVRRAQLRNRNVVILILSASLLLFVVALIVIYLGYRKRNTLYKNIVMQHKNAIERERVLRLRLEKAEAVTGSRAGGNPKKIDEGKASDIYERLCLLMDSERLYANAQINREQLADILGTNRTYLSQIIKECSGLSLPQFINQYRVQAAVNILSDSGDNVSMKELYAKIGFTSQSSFFRAFKGIVGMTPSEYRNYAVKT